MKQLAVVLGVAVAVLAPALFAAGAPAADPSRGTEATQPVVLEKGDPRLQRAHECLYRSGDEETDQVLLILEATGFSLHRVTLTGTKRDPDRLTFGYEFRSRSLVKTVYWEADCPAKESTDSIATR